MFKNSELAQGDPKVQQGVDNDDDVDSVSQCKDACINLDSCVAFTYRKRWDNPCILHEDREDSLELQTESDVDHYQLTRNCGEYRSVGSNRTKSRSNRKY